MFLVRFIFFGVAFLMGTPAFAMGNVPSTSMTNSSLIGRAAPDFTLDTTGQSNVNFTKFREGKRAVIFFWATWCPHCHEEIENLNLHLDKMEQQGIKIALVDLGESKDEVKSYLAGRNFKLDSFMDTDSILSGPYDLIGVPTLYFVDEQGIIRDLQHAFPANYEELFKK